MEEWKDLRTRRNLADKEVLRPKTKQGQKSSTHTLTYIHTLTFTLTLILTNTRIYLHTFIHVLTCILRHLHTQRTQDTWYFYYLKLLVFA